MSVSNAMDKLDQMDPAVRVLMDNGKRRGFVTYEEMNQVLPNDIDNIDQVLTLLEESGIAILDEADLTEEQAANRIEPVDERREKVMPTERIDDPVRMYLTQMGEIPLLTREEEISLARKIELTRKQFRKDVLSSGFGLASAIEILEDVVRGELAFDRTLKVNQQDPGIGKADLSDRLPGNIETLRRLYDAARGDFCSLVEIEARRSGKKNSTAGAAETVTLMVFRAFRNCAINS